jgi:hypothetical protein
MGFRFGKYSLIYIHIRNMLNMNMSRHRYHAEIEVFPRWIQFSKNTANKAMTNGVREQEHARISY